MATRALNRAPVKEFTYLWEGKDRAGKILRGEMRAGGPARAMLSLVR